MRHLSSSLPLTTPHGLGHHPSSRRIITCSVAGASQDVSLLRRAADLADRSAGCTSPHPNFGCVITRGSSHQVVGEAFLYAQGTKCAELQAVQAAGELARGGVVYLNLEPGDCYGDHTAVSALVQVPLIFSWGTLLFSWGRVATDILLFRQESHVWWWVFATHFSICVGKPYNLSEVKVFKFMFWEKICKVDSIRYSTSFLSWPPHHQNTIFLSFPKFQLGSSQVLPNCQCASALPGRLSCSILSSQICYDPRW